MAWMKRATATVGTQHTCGGPKFGRLTDGCPRCEELKSGATVRTWSNPLPVYDHKCSAKCGIVCTYGEW